jgi:hypothetical protein
MTPGELELRDPPRLVGELGVGSLVIVEMARIFLSRSPMRRGAAARASTTGRRLLVMDTRTIAIAAFVVVVIVVLVVFVL